MASWLLHVHVVEVRHNVVVVLAEQPLDNTQVDWQRKLIPPCTPRLWSLWVKQIVQLVAHLLPSVYAVAVAASSAAIVSVAVAAISAGDSVSVAVWRRPADETMLLKTCCRSSLTSVKAAIRASDTVEMESHWCDACPRPQGQSGTKDATDAISDTVQM